MFLQARYFFERYILRFYVEFEIFTVNFYDFLQSTSKPKVFEALFSKGEGRKARTNVRFRCGKVFLETFLSRLLW